MSSKDTSSKGMGGGSSFGGSGGGGGNTSCTVKNLSNMHFVVSFLFSNLLNRI